MGNSQIESEVALFNNAGDSDSSKPASSADIDLRKRSVHSDRKGYSSEIPSKIRTRKKRFVNNRRKLSDVSNSEDSESDDPVVPIPPLEKNMPEQSNEPAKTVNWWRLFNNNSLVTGCNDDVYLEHNFKYIDMILSNFEEVMNMIDKRISQISNITDETELLQNSNILHLMKKVQALNLKNVEKLSYENMEEFQRFFSFLSLTSFVTQCMTHDETERSKKFNILELINFYYDFFWIMMAFKIKTMSTSDPSILGDRIMKMRHILFSCLFRMNPAAQSKRTRIDEKEFMASSILLDFCTNSMKRYFLNFEKEKYTLQLIFPPHLFTDEKKHFYNSSQEEKNALIMANILLFTNPRDIQSIEKYGMRVLNVNKSLFEVFHTKTLEKLNRVLYFNFIVLNEIVSVINQMWFSLWEKYSNVYVPLLYHSPETLFQSLIPSEKLEKSVLLHSSLHEIDYVTKADVSKGFFEKSVNIFALSAFSMESISKIQKVKNSAVIKTRKSKEDKEWLFNNIIYRLNNFIENPDCFELMIYLLFEIQIFKEKAFLGQNFVMSGQMIINRSHKYNGFRFSLYHEIKPNLLSVLFANFRFFPCFDITLVSYFQKIRQLNCHVILDYLSPLFMTNGIVYNQALKKIVINFNINMKHIRQSIFQNPSISVGSDRLPTKTEELYLPLSWLSESGDASSVPEYVRQNLTKIYGASDRFVISNLMIASLTQNDVLKNGVIVLNTRKEKRMEVTRDEINDTRVKYKSPITTALFSKSLILSEEIVDNITSVEKKFILDNIDSVQEIHSIPVVFRKSIGNFEVMINLNSFETVRHKETKILCIDSFNISMILNSDDIRSVLENWLMLYQLWPFNSSRIMSHLCLPVSSGDNSPH